MSATTYAVTIQDDDGTEEEQAEWIKLVLLSCAIGGVVRSNIEVEVIGTDINRGEDGCGVCFRCNEEVGSQWELVWLDSASRNDCPESEDGAPHEIDEPE